ncbi:MAG TPA: alkaline phosphatase [Bacteroidales bacterium]|nr:alkaline phosphatase [Bacteroidales bacterium]
MKYFLALFSLVMVATFSGCSGVKQTAHSKDATAHPIPKNIIFIIGDGMGFNHVLAANYFQHGASGMQPYEQEDWTRLASSTYPAIVSRRDGAIIFADGYSPQRAWTDSSYVARNYTDSGAGGTALATGRKTYNNSIAIGVQGDTLLQVTRVAEELGKSTGIVTTVHIAHATPAAFGAHNLHRNNFADIARYMLFNTRLDVLMGAGNPDFDDNGLAAASNDQFIGGRQLWQQISANNGVTEFTVDGKLLKTLDSDGDAVPDPWTVIQSRQEFQNLATGRTPARVLGIAKANNTLQDGRTKPAEEALPFQTPLNTNVPSLKEMTLAALNVLNQNPKGFFVMIEGGAIDWASHDNDLVRIIEAQIDLNQTVEAAIQWVETHSSWDETLIIVTSDHETGHLTGPDHPQRVNSPVISQGKGKLPLYRFNSGDHTNSLVPFYAKGAGQELFRIAAGGFDPVKGAFLQNVQIPQAIFLLWGKPQVQQHRQTR